MKAFLGFVRVGCAGALVPAALGLCLSCGSDSSFTGNDDDRTIKPVVSQAVHYEPVLEDDFDGAKGAPPPAHWGYEIGNGNYGWGNEQLEYDTNRPENVSLDGEGHLVITARKEKMGGFDYTSARLITRPGAGANPKGFVHAQGRFEIRAKMPKGRGLWPAFWMLGNNGVNWPQCGEIDVLEFRGHNLSEVRGSLHGPGYAGAENFGRDFDTGVDLTEDFHTFGVTWSPLGVSFDFDGEAYFSALESEFPEALEWVFDHDFFLILNLAVGGKYLMDAQPDDSTPEAAKLVVDYVHVYRLVEP